ncbi:MAG: hypothetical protein LQ339_002356 [Xanthoria mediterranea]|nr:MAG: hypothetical protein LQ339_002356 [Xanthoria mediterranea]
MAPPRGSAAYKKQDGTLAISKDGQSVSWTPVTPPGSKPTVTFPLSTITNLQQTPATTPKVMLKVFAQPPGASAPETHVFNFTSPTAARAEADAIKDALSNAIQQAKAGGVIPAAPGGSASSAAMAIASAASAGRNVGASQDGIYDDSRLQSNAELQHSLLQSNPQLKKTFIESLRTKPNSITDSQFTSQFWSTRIHLLRTHAIEKSQTKASYNILASIKPEGKDGEIRLSISKEQVQLIFNQHAIVRRAYDENVPRFSESEFWAKFFRSRLFKKLQGKRIQEDDAQIPALDKYLDLDAEAEPARRAMASHIPHIIDVEGNDVNHSQRKGNETDLYMRSHPTRKEPVIRILNNMSEKMLSQVAPNDIDPSLPIGVDEETYNSLALQDLRDENDEDRVILKIRDQSHLRTSEDDTISPDEKRFAALDPTTSMQSLLANLATTTSPSFHLDNALNISNDNEDSSSSSDEESSSQPQPPKTSKSQPPKQPKDKNPIQAATTQILSSIRTNASHLDTLTTSSPTFSTTASTNTFSLSPQTFDRLSLTHATTTEFLSHFWSAFLSGNPALAPQLSGLVESLNRALDRINAVADEAEREREKTIEEMKRKVRVELERTGRKRRVDYASIGGGAEVVRGLLAPTVVAVERAVEEYTRALKEAGGGVGGAGDEGG